MNTHTEQSRTSAPGFAALGLPDHLINALAKQGITDPFPIQTAAIPAAINGRDVLGRGRTGSGKTVAFAVPTVMALDASGKRRQVLRPRALVLVPTRELARQVAETFAPLARAAGMTVTTVFGGVGYGPQLSALRKGVDVLIATPGRLEDLIKSGNCNLDAVEVAVLDEADHMADLGFLPPVKRLLDATPKTGQRLFFSATLDKDIDVLVRRYTRDPLVVEVDPPVSVDSTPMEHHVFAVAHNDKTAIVHDLAAGHGRTLFFTRTKHMAKRMASNLTKAGIPAVDLHGNLSQKQRERNLAAFSNGQVRVLVATDIAARGIHVDDIGLVVHVDPPADHKTYLHRSGRTARAGSGGTVITLATPDQHGSVRGLSKRAGINPTRTNVSEGHSVIEELRGPRAPHVEPVVSHSGPAQPAAARPARGRSRRPQQRHGAHSDRGAGRSGRGRGSSQGSSKRSPR